MEESKSTEELLCKTKTGIEIYIDDDTRQHIWSAHSSMKKEEIIEAISKLDYSGSPDGKFCSKAEAVNMERIVGRSGIKTITDDSEVKTLYRKKRDYPSRVILDGEGDETNELFVVVGYIPDLGKNYLFTAAYGGFALKEPGDPSIKTDEEREESVEFYNTHAIVASSDEIDWERSKELLDTQKEDLKNKQKDKMISKVIGNMHSGNGRAGVSPVISNKQKM